MNYLFNIVGFAIVGSIASQQGVLMWSVSMVGCGLIALSALFYR